MPKSQIYFHRPHLIKRKKSILKNRFFWIFILASIALIVICYFLCFWSFFQIKNIVVTGEGEATKEDIQSAVKAKMGRNILFWKSESIFLASPGEIRKEILKTFPGIAEAEVRRSFFNSLSIIVVERLKLATWCTQDKCFLLDNEGVIFKETQTGETSIKIISKRNMEIPGLGQTVIEKDYINKISEIEKKLNEVLKIGVGEFIVFDERLNVKTAEDWEIYFDQNGDINWQLTELGLVLEKQIPAEKRGDLEYIDLRFSRVYLKYRQ